MANSENKTSRARLNLFDIILILAVILCIAGIALHAYFTKDLGETYSQNATISFVVSGVSEETAGAFSNPNSPIYDSTSDKLLGTLIEVSYSPMPVDAETADGKLVRVEHPEKMEIRGKAVLKGSWTEENFYIDGSLHAVIGATLGVYTDSATCILTITGVAP